MSLINAAMFGLTGGVVRGVVGIVKSVRKRKKLRTWYFLFTIASSGLIGMFAGMLLPFDYRISLLAGYAGIDLIESLYKIGKRKL